MSSKYISFIVNRIAEDNNLKRVALVKNAEK